MRNLTFDDYTEDACSFEGGSKTTTNPDEFDSKNIWVHHNTINEGINYWDVCSEQDKHEGDGGTDFKYNAYVTLSYNHYVGCHKTGLIGGGDSQQTASVTFHHNWYENCGSRLPLARQANMHMYNNYYDGSTGTNMSLRAGAYAFIENCFFDNAKNPVTTQDGDGKRGVAKIYNCTFNGQKLDTSKYDVEVVSDRAAKVDNDNVFNKNFDTDPSAFYYADGRSDVEIMHDTAEVPAVVPLLAGAMGGREDIDLGGSSAEQPGGGETDPDRPGGETGGEIASEAVTSVIFDDYADNLTSELVQGSEPVYFNADGTVSTVATDENKIISWYGNNASVILKTGQFTSGDTAYTNCIQTGGSSNDTRRYFIIDLSDYVGSTVTISAYASHTSGSPSDGGRAVYIYGSTDDIGSDTQYVAVSEKSQGTKDGVTVTASVAVTQSNCKFYVAGNASILVYGVSVEIK